MMEGARYCRDSDEEIPVVQLGCLIAGVDAQALAVFLVTFRNPWRELTIRMKWSLPDSRDESCCGVVYDQRFGEDAKMHLGVIGLRPWSGYTLELAFAPVSCLHRYLL